MRQGASASSRVPRDRAAFGLPRSPLHILSVQNLIDNYFFINEKINISWLVRLHNKGRRARSDCWCRTGYSCGWRWRGWAFQTPPQDKLNFTTQKNAPGPSPAPLIVSSASPAATVRDRKPSPVRAIRSRTCLRSRDDVKNSLPPGTGRPHQDHHIYRVNTMTVPSVASRSGQQPGRDPARASGR